MDGGRRQKWVNYRDYSQNKRGPRGSWFEKNKIAGSWKSNAWEKEFCKVVGTMEWGTFLYKKRYRHLMPNVLTWNDSAGKEAFDNAWRRFWYEKKGYDCDTPLPDPDLYNDIIDWDAEVDPELWADLENIPVANHTDQEEDKGPAGYSPVLNYQDITPTGWGDDHVPQYVGPGWENVVGPSHVPPYAGPTVVWQYPAPGGYWYYTNYNYVGYLPVTWSYNNVATNGARAFEPSYRTQTKRNGGGWRKQKYTKNQSGGQMQGRRMQSK